MRRWLVAGLLLAGMAPAMAQSLTNPRDAQYRRQLRALESRAVTDPAGAAAGAAAAQRALRNEGSGVNLPPARALLDRQLGAAGTAAAARARQLDQSQPVPGPPQVPADLPSSTGDPGALLPSMSPLFTPQALLGRATIGLDEGRTASARSDLSLAASQLRQLRRSGRLAADDPDLLAAEAQAAALNQRLPP